MSVCLHVLATQRAYRLPEKGVCSVNHQGAAPAAKSDVNDCLVIVVVTACSC